MNRLLKKYSFIFALFKFFLGSFVANSQTNADSTYLSEIVNMYAKAGAESLQNLMAYNSTKIAQGDFENTSFVFDFDNAASTSQTIPTNAVFSSIDTKDKFKVHQAYLDNFLRGINIKLAELGKPLIYVGINSSLGYILTEKKLKSGIHTTDELEKVSSQRDLIDQKDISKIYTVYSQIYDKIAQLTTVYAPNPNNGIEIICFGAFENYTINNTLSDDIISDLEKLKANIKATTWQFCNFKGVNDNGWGNDSKNRAIVYNDFPQFPPNVGKYETINDIYHLTSLASQIKKTLTGEKIFISKGRLHKDLYDPQGALVGMYEADVKEDDVIRVNTLLEEMMNDEMYAQYIKEPTTKSQKKITAESLKLLEEYLLDLKDVCQAQFKEVTPSYIDQIINLYKQCNNSTYNTCEVETYVPRCLWDNGNTYTAYIADPAFASGIVDGAIDAIKGVFDIAKMEFDIYKTAYCWIPSIDQVTPSCKEVRQNSLEIMKSMSDFFTPDKVLQNTKDICSSVYNTIKNDGNTYLKEITDTDNCARYRQGRLAFDVISTFVGIEEIKAITVGGKSIASVISQVANKAKTSLTKIATNGKDLALKVGTKLDSKALRKGVKASIVALTLNTADGKVGDAIAFIAPIAISKKGRSGAIDGLKKSLGNFSDDVDNMVAKIPVTNNKADIVPENVLNDLKTATSTVLAETSVKELHLYDNLEEIEKAVSINSPLHPNYKYTITLEVPPNGEKYLVHQVVDNVSKIKRFVAVSTLVGNGVTKAKRVLPDEEKESKCEICNLILSKTDDALCTKLSNLASKNSLNGKKSVEKLCASDPYKIKLGSLVDKILVDFTQSEAKNFLDDIAVSNGNEHYISYQNNLKDLSIDYLDAWLFIQRNLPSNAGSPTKFTQDFTLIKTLSGILKAPDRLRNFEIYVNSTAKETITNLADFLKAYNYAGCNTCGVPSGKSTTMEFLDKLLITSEKSAKYRNIIDYLAFGRAEPFNKGVNSGSRDGGQHMLRIMNQGIIDNNYSLTLNPETIDKIDSQFNYNNGPHINENTKQFLPCLRCKYDLKLKNTDDNAPIFVEFKSYEERKDLSLGITTSLVGMPQFLSYLAHPDVKSFKNLVYVFNDAKLNQGEDSPQNMMRQLYIKYAKEIFYAKKELFTSVKLFEPKGDQIYIKTHQDLEDMARFTESEKMNYFKYHFLSFIISK